MEKHYVLKNSELIYELVFLQIHVSEFIKQKQLNQPKLLQALQFSQDLNCAWRMHCCIPHKKKNKYNKSSNPAINLSSQRSTNQWL